MTLATAAVHFPFSVVTEEQIHEEDRRLFREHLAGFVPPGSFDAHAHLFRTADLGPKPPLYAAPGFECGFARFLSLQQSWMGALRPADGLFFALPNKNMDIPAANQFIEDEVRPHTASRALLLVAPGDDPQVAEARAASGPFVGFKVYHLFAKRERTFDASTGEFLPEWVWEISHRHGLAIMLHMVRSRALADADNQRYIAEHCRRYSGAKLILAHAARGFNAGHTLEGIGALAGLDNVFFDTSAVCESTAFEAILARCGVSRLCWGSDAPISQFRGRCVGIGDSFYWMYGHNVDWAGGGPGASPSLVGAESLLALKQACQKMHLNDSDVERLFCHNARNLLGLPCKTAGNAAALAPGVRVQELYREAKTVIPGGTQLLSKRPEMFAPEQWPAYFEEAHGCEIVDVEGRRFLDFGLSGIGACLLGYADPDVSSAVIRRVTLGSLSTLNSAQELELARLLLGMNPWAQQVRYARCGGEAMAIAARLARAVTGKDKIAFCGYHGWQDWYLAANVPAPKAAGAAPAATGDALAGHLLPGLEPTGVPAALGGTCFPFAYNRIEQFQAVLAQHGDELAAVIMEPTRSVDPNPGFLETIREETRRRGIVLVIDEITTGFRLAPGGAHARYGLQPDMAVYAKALGNGHPIAAVIGTTAAMQGAHKSFISSTYWTESVGFAAGVATLKKLQQVDVVTHVARIGTRVQEGWRALGQKHQLPCKASGHPCLSVLAFDHPKNAALLTLFTARMLQRGFLAAGGFYPTLAHQDHHVERYLAAADEVFPVLAQALASNNIEAAIGGPVKHTGFARLT